MYVGIVHTAAAGLVVATRYTRYNNHNLDHHTESLCPCIMSTSEVMTTNLVRVSCAGTSARAARAVLLYIVLLLYDVANIIKVRCMSYRKKYLTYIEHIPVF